MNESKKFIKTLAAVIEGLQVPLSLPIPLGTARDPYVSLREQLGVRGWASKEEIEEIIQKKFHVELKDGQGEG